MFLVGADSSTLGSGFGCLLLHGELLRISWGCDLGWGRDLTGVCPAVLLSSDAVMIYTVIRFVV